MIDATTYYVFSNDIDTDIDAQDAEDTERFRPGELTAVVYRSEYDKLRDLTAKLAGSAQRLMELEEQRAKLCAETVSTASVMIREWFTRRDRQLMLDALSLLSAAEGLPMWDDECEAKARDLMSGLVDDVGKPPLEEQQAVANWLNQMMPYPGWVLEVYGASMNYWVVKHEQQYVYVSRRDTDGMYYGPARSEPAATLMEFLTKRELGL